MADVILMEWQGATLAQYDEVMRLADLENNPPSGVLYHVATHDGSTLRIIDVWEDAGQFQAFAQSRLMGVVQQAGIQDQPNISVYPAHKVLPYGYNAK